MGAIPVDSSRLRQSQALINFMARLYDYLRNGFFDAQDWFNDYFSTKQSALRQNDFGGTLGGPVQIPGLYSGKNRTFFFVSYEGLRLTAPQAATVNFVPDVFLRTHAPTPLQQVLNAFPMPNGIDDGVNHIAQYVASWSNPSSLNATSVKFDHVVREKVRLFFRFSDTPSNSTTRGNSANYQSPSMNTTAAYSLRTYTAGASSTLTNHIGNEVRVNYSSNGATNRVLIDAFGGSAPIDLAQLVGLSASASPLILLNYGGYVIQLYQQQQFGTQRQWNFVDTLSISLGRHQFKFGVDYRRLTPFAIPYNPDLRYYYFSEAAVEQNSALTFGIENVPAYPLYQNLSAFAEDEWRMSSRLNLSLGLRWEVNPAPGVTQGLKPYTVQGSTPDTWTLAPQGTPLWQTTWYNFAPRLGIAYTLHITPGWETVLRGGGGVFYDTGQQLGSLGFGGPGFSSVSGFPVAPFPSLPTIPPIVNPPVAPYTNYTVYGFPQHLQLPYTLQWNASIEQALGKPQALTVTYVGSHAARLLQESFFSPANNPNANFFVLVKSGLTSDYDALQVQFRRRLSSGLTILGSYTWSHCIDYGSQNYVFGYQRGNCDFDVRHNLSTALSYDLPNIANNRFVGAILHNWGLDDRLIVRTAFPITLFGNQLLLPNAQIYDGGLSFVPGQPVYLTGGNCAAVLQSLGTLPPGKGCPGGRAINPSAFEAVDTGLGDTPRNFARLFGAWQMNLAVRRSFPVGERVQVQFRAEAFNIFNHPNFGSVYPYFGANTFGQATATLANSLGVLSPLYQMGGPRSMQFALKLVF